MAEGFPILSLILLVPLVGSMLIFFIPGTARDNICNVALLTTVATFGLSLWLWGMFDYDNPAFQFVEFHPWFGERTGYRVGIDGISILFIVLTTFLMPFCILTSWRSIEHRIKEYMIAFLVLETTMIGVFSALDLFLFYLFFEGGLIPMFLIIGVWGGARRVYASFKFFLYTLLGSVFMLVAILYMYYQAGTTDIPEMMEYAFDPAVQTWLWLGFFASFAVKLPMWPVHTWLPDAHVEAPTAGSVILAGVLLKMGGYGFLRFSLPMFPHASAELVWLVFTLSLIAVVYTSLVALAQENMKKLIAYASVAHMGFVTLGIFVVNTQGVEGAIFHMLSHGIVSGALFLVVGVVYDRLHTHEISRYGGLVSNMPKYAVAFMVFTLASVGLPGTSGFIGEILVLFGAYKYSSWLAFIAAIGIVLGVAYMLYLYWRVVLGKLEKPDVKEMLDLNWREIAIFAPLVIVVIWMGVYPSFFLDVIHASVDQLLVNYHAALEAAPLEITIGAGQ